MDLSSFKQQLTLTVSALKEDLKTIRTGRANPVIVEQLMVEAYGGSAKLKVMELASITTEGPAAIVIVPFDPATTPEIEKAILKSPLGLTPQTQGNRITIRIPPLSQEQRDKYVKLVGQKVEEKKNIIRNHRDDARKKVRLQFDAKELTEDDKFRVEKEIDLLTQKVNDELVLVKEAKESEIQAV